MLSSAQPGSNPSANVRHRLKARGVPKPRSLEELASQLLPANTEVAPKATPVPASTPAATSLESGAVAHSLESVAASPNLALVTASGSGAFRDSKEPITLTPEKMAELIVYREELNRALDAKQMIDASTLKPTHSVKRIVTLNGVSLIFTIPAMSLYFATAGNTGQLELFDTVWSNCWQTQKFTYESLSNIYDTGWDRRLINRVGFAIVFAIPNGLAAYLTATDGVLWGIPFSPSTQGILAGLGNVPQNFFSREYLQDIIQNTYEWLRFKMSCEREVAYLKKIQKLQEKTVRAFQAFIDDHRDPEQLDALFLDRKLPTAEQFRKLFQGKEVPNLPPENSKFFEGVVFTFKIGGAIGLLYSSTGYGLLLAFAMGGSIVFAQVSGYTAATPLYALSLGGGTKFGEFAWLPWAIPKFFTNTNYRNHTWPSVVALGIAGGTSFKSYGTSEALVQDFGPEQMIANKVSLGVIQGKTGAFNTIYEGISVESLIRVSWRWLTSWKCPTRAQREEKYNQLIERLKELTNMSVEKFIAHVNYLRKDPQALLKLFGNDKESVRQVLNLIDGLEAIRLFNKTAPKIEDAFATARVINPTDNDKDAASIRALTKSLMGMHAKRRLTPDSKESTTNDPSNSAAATKDGYVKITDEDEEVEDAFLDPGCCWWRNKI